MSVLHSCDDGLCVNPAHLSAGSHAENMMDKARKRRGGVAKLGPYAVRQIRYLAAAKVPYRRIAKVFEVGLTAVFQAARGSSYAWVE